MNSLIICGSSPRVRMALLAVALLTAGKVLAFADPTAPEAQLQTGGTAAPQAAQALPRLTLIRQAGKERLAVLDGQARRVGAQHGVYRVEAIGAGQVELSQGQRRLTLQLFPSIKSK